VTTAKAALDAKMGKVVKDVPMEKNAVAAKTVTVRAVTKKLVPVVKTAKNAENAKQKLKANVPVAKMVKNALNALERNKASGRNFFQDQNNFFKN